MLWIETCLLLLSLLLALTFPALGERWFERFERTCSRLAHRPVLYIVLIGVLAIGSRLALLPALPVPEPVVHDEFGYLLSADTFSHGRLTNPSHHLWPHFESFSILQRPSYQCFAQPAQGLLLATGNVLFGHPFWGVCLSAGLMCAAFVWMLQAWVPPEWALLGGALSILRFATVSYWANSYWGGAAGAIGGALLLGSFARLKASFRTRDALLMGVGVAILANSRPYEGFVLAIAVAAGLFSWILSKQAPPLRISFSRIVLPVCAVLLAVAVAMGCYFKQVTGSPFRMPYQVERETYAVSPYLLWQHERPLPSYHHADFRRMYAEDDVHSFHQARTGLGVVLLAIGKVLRTWLFFFGPALSFPILMMAFVLPFGFTWKDISPQVRFLLLVTGFFFLALFGELYYEPHYAAPVTCALVLLALSAMQKLQSWQTKGRASGVFLNRAIVAICVISFILRTAASPLHIALPRSVSPAWYQIGPASFGRAALAERLKRLPGQELVIVHYRPDHNIFNEWVYNDADIDNSQIVWAREMDIEENRRLISYYPSRRVWVLDADAVPPSLTPYSETSQGAQSNVALGAK